MAEPLRDGASAPAEAGYARLPKSVLSLRFAELSDAEKVVALAISTLDRFGRGTDATDKQIGAACGKTEKKIGPIVSSLVRKGFLLRQTSGRYRRLVRTWRFPSDTPERGVCGRDSFHPGSGGQDPPKGGDSAPGSGGLGPPEVGGSLDIVEQENSYKPGGSNPAGKVAGTSPRRNRWKRDDPPAPRDKPPEREFHRVKPPDPPLPDDVQCPEELAWLTTLAAGKSGFEAVVSRVTLSIHRRAVDWYTSRGLPLPEATPERRQKAREWLKQTGIPIPPPDPCCGKTPGGGLLAKVPPHPVGQTIHD